jgi:uncharacterized protein (TIGR03067 family)
MMRRILLAVSGFSLALAFSLGWNPGVWAQDKDDLARAKLAAIEKRLADLRKQIEVLRRQEETLLQEREQVKDLIKRMADLVPPATDHQIEAELKALQGAWALVGYEREGHRLSPEEFAKEFPNEGAKLGLQIEGAKLILGTGEGRKEFAYRRAGRAKEWTWQLRPAQTPKAFDISTVETGLYVAGTWTFEGGYRLKGERLEVCGVFTLLNEERPTDFSTKPGSWRRLLLYERVKSPAK